MSPAIKKATVNLSAVVSAIVIVVGAAYKGGAEVVTIADTRYVRDSVYRLAQEGTAMQRLRDSTSNAARLDAIETMLANLDSTDRCRRGVVRYCR